MHRFGLLFLKLCSVLIITFSITLSEHVARLGHQGACVALRTSTPIHGRLMLALPAKAATPEADAVMAASTLKHTDTLSAVTAEVTIVELESALHELVFTTQDCIQLLHVLVASVNLTHQ